MDTGSAATCVWTVADQRPGTRATRHIHCACASSSRVDLRPLRVCGRWPAGMRPCTRATGHISCACASSSESIYSLSDLCACVGAWAVAGRRHGQRGRTRRHRRAWPSRVTAAGAGECVRQATAAGTGELGRCRRLERARPASEHSGADKRVRARNGWFLPNGKILVSSCLDSIEDVVSLRGNSFLNFFFSFLIN